MALDETHTSWRERLSSRVLLLVLLAAIGSALSTPAWGQALTGKIIYVNAAAGGNNDGTTWADAFTDLQPALTAAVSGDQIWVAAGTYKPSAEKVTGNARSVTFAMKTGVRIYGGFPASGTPGWFDRNWATNVTTLSGDVGTPDDVSDNAYHVVTIGTDVGSATSLLDGFTITGGNANVSSTVVSDGDWGGGILNRGIATLRHLVIHANRAGSTITGGGGMANASGPIVMSDVSFDNNTAPKGAGLAEAATASLDHVTFTSNAAQSGGGVYVLASLARTLTWNHVTFSGNSATNGGGGAYFEAQAAYPYTVNITNAVFRGNTSGYPGGGGIATYANYLNITNSVFAENSAYQASASNYGGAILVFGGAVNVTNSTFDANQANYGSGVTVSGGFATVVNSILWDVASGSLAKANEIRVQGNDASAAYSDVLNAGSPFGEINVTDGGGNVDTDPFFVDPPADVHLTLASPVIDAGDNSAAGLSGVTTDLDGNPRVLDGTVDLGAYERTSPNAAPLVTADPVSQSAAEWGTATFTAAASGFPAPAVQWQVNTGAAWSPIYGATSAAYSTQAMPGMDGYQFRAVFTNSEGPATTAAATLTVGGKPSISTQPSNVTVVAGQPATFEAVASGATSAQWQNSTDSGTSWSDITGATSTSYVISATTSSMNGYMFRVRFSNSYGSITSEAALLTVNVAPVITQQPASQTVTIGALVTFTAAADGRPTPTVQWQRSPDGSSWSDLTGETSTSLTFTAQLTDDGYHYRAVFTNDVTSTATNDAVLTIGGAPTVTQQPADKTVTEGATATFTAAAGGTPTPDIQWQVKGGTFKRWTDIAGATSTSYTTDAVTLAMNGYQYRAVFTNVLGTATTRTATLTVTTAPADVGVSTAGVYTSGTATITWTIDLSNAGPNTALGVQVADTVGTGMKIVSVTGGSSYKIKGRTVIVDYGALPVGTATHAITIQAAVSRSTGTWTNAVSVTTTSTDTTTANNTATGTVTVP